MKTGHILMLVACAGLVVCCAGGSGENDHGHQHSHSAASHDGTDHGAHEHGHDHGGYDHVGGASGAPLEVVTHFTAQTELFVEFPVLTAGVASPFAAHLTRLADYAPVEGGTVTVVLSGGGEEEERFSVKGADSPGIFRPVVKPVHAGTRSVQVRLDSSSLSVSHEIGEFSVFTDRELALELGECEAGAEHGKISFLKEQQWKVDFGIFVVEEIPLRTSISAYGTLRARSDGEAHVVAPLAGRIATFGEAFPRIGQQVTPEQILVTLAPRLDDAGDGAALELGVQRARLDRDHAVFEQERLEGLLAGGAVAERRVVTARNEVALRRAELKAATRRLKQSKGLFKPSRSGAGKGGINVRPPVVGTITRVAAAPGAFVNEGDELFHVADLDRLWLEVRVSEADVDRLGDPTGAWLEQDGGGDLVEIGAEGLVTVGGVLDPLTRTVPVIFELPNPGGRLRIGTSVRAHVVVGDPISALAVPGGAILREEGRDVVMVMVDGESFERRVVELGVRDAGMVQVISGLAPGERVVSNGGYFVRLAGSSSAIPAHGHAH